MSTRYTIPLSAAAVLLITPRAHAQWQPVGEAGSNYAIAVHGDQLFAGMQGDSIYVSGDQGDSWTAANTGITNSSNWWLSSIDGVLYCGTQSGAAFRSTDDGANWEDIGLLGVRGFAEHNDTLYAAQWYAGAVHWSVDEGETWNPTAAMSGSGGLWPMLSYHGHLFVGAQGGGVFRIQHSTDAWTQMNTGLTGTNVYTFAAIGDRLFLGGTNGVWYSDNDGVSWQASGLIGQVTYALHAVGTRLFAAGDFGIQLSTDNGATWTDFGAGLTSALIARLTNDADYLYAGGYAGGGVHRRPLIEAVGVDEAVAALDPPLLFPVPAHDRVQLSWPGHVAVRYRIRDLAGTLADEGALRDGVIGLDRLTAGVYLLEAVGRKGERAVLRLIRE